ncbi:HAD hydrolase-like protein [Paenibacillus sp. FSL R7-0345]|uniref:HAD family hydrolase n=1 Tax=Paenibacillus sp. FSL R7-0345 TaxID=2954535 RepID=UPI00315ABF1A
MPIQAVLFDFDGTLADTLPLSFTAFRTVFKQYENREVTNEELVAMFGPTEEEIIEVNFTDKAAAPQAVQDYFSIYEAGHNGESVRNSEINGLLQLLKDRGIRMAVITGKAAGLRTYGVRWLSTFQSQRYDVEPDGVFNSVAEFVELLDKDRL